MRMNRMRTRDRCTLPHGDGARSSEHASSIQHAQGAKNWIFIIRSTRTISRTVEWIAGVGQQQDVWSGVICAKRLFVCL